MQIHILSDKLADFFYIYRKIYVNICLENMISESIF